jgi:hypothetical protein
MKPTSEQISKNFWWNQIDPINENFENVFPSKVSGSFTQPNNLICDWNFGRDFAAYAYELARRADRKLKLRPYPKLTVDESQFPFRAFGEKKGRKTYQVCIRNFHAAEPLASQAGYSQPVIWKLDAPKNTLIKSFEKFIEQQQNQHGIKPRKTPGDTSKSPPWNYVELLDKADLLGVAHIDRAADPERTLRTARSDAKKYFQIFKSQWKKETGKNQNLRACLWPELERLFCK